MTAARVLWVVVDSLGLKHVTAPNMDWLCDLGAQGAVVADGAEAVLPALTYPNFASFVTGSDPQLHGVTGNHVFSDGRWVEAAALGPGVATVFQRAAAGGLRTVALFGDQNLVGVCGATAASRHWPEDGQHAPGVELAATGYATDAEVVTAAEAAGLATHELAFVQLDEMDSVQHIHGPGSGEATRASARVDAALARLAEIYAGVWDETVVIVTSDHEQEFVGDTESVPFDSAIAHALDTPMPDDSYAGDPLGRWRSDGTAAWVDAPTRALLGNLRRLPGVQDESVLADGSAVVWGESGVVLGLDWGQSGDHGSIRTARQVAVVGGGHPQAAHIGEVISAHRPRVTDWADLVMAALLDTSAAP